MTGLNAFLKFEFLGVLSFYNKLDVFIASILELFKALLLWLGGIIGGFDIGPPKPLLLGYDGRSLIIYWL